MCSFLSFSEQSTSSLKDILQMRVIDVKKWDTRDEQMRCSATCGNSHVKSFVIPLFGADQKTFPLTCWTEEECFYSRLLFEWIIIWWNFCKIDQGFLTTWCLSLKKRSWLWDTMVAKQIASTLHMLTPMPVATCCSKFQPENAPNCWLPEPGSDASGFIMIQLCHFMVFVVAAVENMWNWLWSQGRTVWLLAE